MKNNRNKDPYLYEDVPVLKNIPGVKTSEELKRIEGDLTRMTMGVVYREQSGISWHMGHPSGGHSRHRGRFAQ